MARINSGEDLQYAPAALQPPVDRSFDQADLGSWVRLMRKATCEDVHGAAEFTERTESNAFYLWHGIERVEDAPASASRELIICFPGLGPVYFRYLGDSAVRSSDERAPPANAAAPFSPSRIPVVRLRPWTDYTRLSSSIRSPVV